MERIEKSFSICKKASGFVEIFFHFCHKLLWKTYFLQDKIMKIMTSFVLHDGKLTKIMF